MHSSYVNEEFIYEKRKLLICGLSYPIESDGIESMDLIPKNTDHWVLIDRKGILISGRKTKVDWMALYAKPVPFIQMR